MNTNRSVSIPTTHIAIVAGDPNAVMDFRLVPESPELLAKLAKMPSEKRARLRLKYRGRLRDLYDLFDKRNAEGYAVFFAVNRSDGEGVKKANMIAARCLVLDLDGTALPDKWSLAPHLIEETSPGRYQCYWPIKETKDLHGYEGVAKRLALHYGGDMSVCDVSRVFRLAGFNHQKTKPFVTRIVHAMDPDESSFDRYTLADFEWLPAIPEGHSSDSDPSDGRLTTDIAAEILDHLPAIEFGSNEAWEPLAMAIHDGCSGISEVRDRFLEWCRTDPQYDNDATEAMNLTRWDSFDGAKGKRRTIGTLIKIAKDHGVPSRIIRKLVRTSAREDFNDGLEFEAPEDDAEFEAIWPRPLRYRGDWNSRENAAVFLDARPEQIISSDQRFYSLDENAQIWREVSDKKLAVEIVKTDPGNNIGHQRIKGIAESVHFDRHTDARPFSWIKRPGDAPDPNDLIVFGNGLLNFDTDDLLPHTGDYFATGTPDFDYQPEADCPLWLEKLGEWLDESFHPTLQEFMGYILTPDVRSEVYMAMLGVTRGGKGTTMHVMQQLVGRQHHISRGLNELSNDFGLDGLQDKRVVFVPDAHDVGPGKHTTALERIKSITGRDEVSINRKNKDIVTAHIPTKIVMAANKLPKFIDESGALSARQLILIYENSFTRKMDPDLRTKLNAELPGIANWALEGLRRLRDRNNRFTVGTRGKIASKEAAEAQSPALRFANHALTVTGDESDFVPLTMVYNQYREWADHVEHLGPREFRGKTDFKSDLLAALTARGVRYHDQKRWREPATGLSKNKRGLFGLKLKRRV